MKKGWIKLDRQVMDHWLYRERRKFSKYEAWLDLMMKVNYMDKKILFDGVLTDVHRGSMLTSLRQLAESWNWSITKVKNFLNLLASEEMIHVKTDTKKTVISIVAYDDSQHGKDTEVSEKKQPKDNEMTEEETNKNVKNLKKVKKETNKHNNSFPPRFENVDMHLARKFFQKMLDNNPTYEQPDIEKWAQDIYLMRTRDRRTEEQITFLMDWTQEHSFWKTRILSPNQLGKRFAKLLKLVKQEQEAKRRVLASEETFVYQKNG